MSGSEKDELMAQLLPLVIELTREAVLLPDQDYEEIAAAVIDGCRARPGAVKLAEAIMKIVSDKRTEIRARDGLSR